MKCHKYLAHSFYLGNVMSFVDVQLKKESAKSFIFSTISRVRTLKMLTVIPYKISPAMHSGTPPEISYSNDSRKTNKG